MIYNNIEQIKRDFEWLTSECTFEHFVTHRLTAYDSELFYKKLDTNIDDKFVLSFFDELLNKFNLQENKWESSVNNTMLPILALIPNVGLRIILELEIDGSYRVLGENGVEKITTLDKDTQFKVLKFKREESKSMSAMQMFKEVALQQKKYLIYAIIASISISILALGASFYSMQVYDRVIPTNGLSTLVSLTVGVAIAIFLEMILKFSRAAIMDQAAKNMDIEYSHNIFERFLSIRADALPRSIGTISGQLQSYASVRGFVSSASMLLLIDIPFALLFLGVIILIGGGDIGLVMVIFLVIAILIGVMFKSKIEELTKTSSMASHKKLGLLVESVENAQKVKATGAKWSMMNKWSQLTEDAINDDIRIKHYTDISTFLATFSQQISYVAIVATGAYLIATTTDMTMGALIAISILSNKVFTPIGQIPNMFVQWGRAKIAVEDLNNIYSLERDNEGVQRPITHKLNSYDIRCENVQFGYDENAVILNIPKLQILKGEKVAVLGVIGAGKSTLLKVISGLYKPTRGKVFLDNIDMHQISRNNISESIGYLAQETKLFSGTLRDNLSIGLVGITDEIILEAAKKTGLIGLISALPKGLDTEVPEGGESVSGGQKQLIALTRMIVANSDVLLLDEPTASMDEGTEKHILKVLKENVSKEQTMVVVTHKPILLELVDRIIIVTPQGIAMDDKKEVVMQLLAQNAIKQQQVKVV
ncbi:MAG: ATP-binding cassette domain-containing protein [Arcobacteraceae bacterium]|nr:ATP-binding cassette domain-containing protein [Arcobacteraceae bacterium]